MTNEPATGAYSEAARQHALALCLSQLGDANTMGNEETLEILDAIDGDPTALYALIRVLTAAVGALATAAAEELAEPARQYDIASEMIRVVFNSLEATEHPNG